MSNEGPYEYDWWGFRVRLPYDFEPEKISVFEKLAGGFLLGAVLDFIWLFCLISPLLQHVDRWWAGSIAVAIVVGSGILGLIIPNKMVADGTFLSFMFILAREKGDLKKWDGIIALLSLAMMCLALFSVESLGLVLVECVFLGVFLSSGLLFLFQKRLDFTSKSWPVEIPEWLKKKEEGTGEQEQEEDEIEGIIPPDKDANPVFDVAINGTKHNVGIKVPENILEILRKINSDLGGYYYQDNHETVILMDRDPVPTEVMSEGGLLRLCRQFFSIGKEYNLTKFQLANLVLRFCQIQIPYAYDHDSTGHIPGGPFNEYGRFPLETLVDKQGDCECTAILCSSILAYLGFDVALIFVDIVERDKRTGHAAVGLQLDHSLKLSQSFIGCEGLISHDNKKYLYGETATESDLKFGSVPGSWVDNMIIGKVMPIKLIKS